MWGDVGRYGEIRGDMGGAVPHLRGGLALVVGRELDDDGEVYVVEVLRVLVHGEAGRLHRALDHR